jgi:hypothetical protein
MNILNKAYFWIFCFAVIFLLSLDFWAWEQEPIFSFLDLPSFVLYFFGLQILLSFAIFVFSRTFWKTSCEEKEL